MSNRLIALSALLLASPLGAQVTATIADAPQCSTCSVQLVPLVQLVNPSDSAGFGITAGIAAAGTPRRYYASSGTFAGQLFQYDATGKFVRAIGHKGEGPGEFTTELKLFAGPGDSIHAVEGRGRYHVIAPNGVVRRTTQINGRVMDFVVERDGTIFAASPNGKPGAAFALQTFSPGGDAIASWDDVSTSPAGAGFNVVGLDKAGQRWSAAMERLDVKQWSKTGAMLKHYSAQRPWLANGVLPTRVDLQHEKPPGRMGGMEFGADGNIYLFEMAADANWKSQQPPFDFQKIWDTIIEVVDPATGKLLARTRFDSMTLPAGNGMAYSMVEDKDGDVRVQLWTLTLKK